MTNYQKNLVLELLQVMSKLSLEAGRDENFNDWLWDKQIFQHDIDELISEIQED